MRIPHLKAIIAALESSKPTHDHYPEPVQRHQDALAAAKHLLAIAEHSVMPGIAEHALAGEIAAAVLADEKEDGCDLGGGLFGTQMTVLIRRIVDVYLARQPVGEPVMRVIDRATKQSAPSELWGRKLTRSERQCWAQGFNAASPAQAVDLGAVADVLRELLTERQHRTDGSLMELAERCRHLSRGDRDCIALRGTLITELEAQAVDLQQFLPAISGLEIAANFQTDPDTAGRMRDAAEHLRAVIDNGGNAQ